MILDINLASRLSARLSAQDENQLLNHIWMGLLGVEALMVLGVALRAMASSRLFNLFTAVGGKSMKDMGGRRGSMEGSVSMVKGAVMMEGAGLGERGVVVVGGFYDGEGFWVRE